MKKKQRLRNIVLSSFLLIFFSSTLVQGEMIIPDQIRVGLKQYFNNVKNISIQNTSLVLGYETTGQWMVETIFESSTGYRIQLAPGRYYLISQEHFSTYEEALRSSLLLSDHSILTYPMYIGPQQWRVDIGGFSSVQQMEEIQSNLLQSGFVFIEDQEQNQRVLIQGDPQSSFFVMGKRDVPQFATGNEKNGVTVWELGERQYRGKMEFHRLDEAGITPVNVLPFEEYLYGVVPAEIIPSWPMESLKAQAVAARNYALYQLNYTRKYEQEPYDLCDTNISQVYKGYSIENHRTTQAVQETQGQLLYYKDELVATYYFSTSGGHTEDAENVWSGAVAYLRGVPDIYEVNPEVGPWREVLSTQKIQQALNNNGVDIGEVVDVNVQGYTTSGRALELQIIGTKGTYSLKKETIRYWLGLKSRKFQLIKGGKNMDTFIYATGNWGDEKKAKTLSTVFVLGENEVAETMVKQNEPIIVQGKENTKVYSINSATEDGFVFEGQGWGHGVGMSQSGAKGMAEQGYTYDQILTHYYSGTTLR